MTFHFITTIQLIPKLSLFVSVIWISLMEEYSLSSILKNLPPLSKTASINLSLHFYLLIFLYLPLNLLIFLYPPLSLFVYLIIHPSQHIFFHFNRPLFIPSFLIQSFLQLKECIFLIYLSMRLNQPTIFSPKIIKTFILQPFSILPSLLITDLFVSLTQIPHVALLIVYSNHHFMLFYLLSTILLTPCCFL